MTIDVINGKRDGFIGDDKVYIGRANKKYNLSESPLANPFVIGKHGNRDDVITKYKDWLYGELLKSNLTPVNQEFRRLCELAKTSNITLVCWCKPSSCHGDVVKEFIEMFINK